MVPFAKPLRGLSNIYELPTPLYVGEIHFLERNNIQQKRSTQSTDVKHAILQVQEDSNYVFSPYREGGKSTDLRYKILLCLSRAFGWF